MRVRSPAESAENDACEEAQPPSSMPGNRADGLRSPAIATYASARNGDGEINNLFLKTLRGDSGAAAPRPRGQRLAVRTL